MAGLKILNADADVKYIKKDGTGTLADPYVSNVFLQDQTTPAFQYYLLREDKTDITLTANAERNDAVVSVSAGHGFDASGEHILIQEGNNYTQTKVTAVNTNDISIQTPISNTFTTAATVVRGSQDANVNGSVTPQEFIFWKRSGDPIDIQFAHITIWNDAAAGDDGTFGDLTELTNGLWFQKRNDVYTPLGTYTTNSDWKEFGGDVTYTDRAGGGGTYAVDIDMDIKKHYGVVIRMDPDEDDKFVATVRDDLSDLKRLKISLQGQSTQNE